MDTTTTGIETLSEREREILGLIARGCTNPEIAETLGLRFDTVKWYVSEIISKLGVRSREEAAAEWRAWQRPTARLRRRVQALLGLGLAAKVGVGGTLAGGAMIGAVVMVGGLASDGPSDATSTPTPVTRPWPTRPAIRDDTEPVGPFVDITSVTFDGRTYTLGMYEAKFGLCMYMWDTDQGPPGTTWRACGGPVTEPHLLGGHRPGRPGILEGIVEPEVVRVRIRLHEGEPIELETVPPPPALDVPWRFWIAAVERAELVAFVDGFDAAGNLVESVPLYDPPGSPPRTTVLPPYEQVNFSESGRDDPTTGTVGIGTGASSFSLDGLAHELRFGVEHDGLELPRIILWCQTGILPLGWDAGTAANGTGRFTVSVPAGNTACHWNVVSADGNLRIFAMP